MGSMANDAAPKGRPFDVQTIKQLVGLMSQHDLNEIDLREGDLRIRLRRGAREVLVSPPPAAPSAAPPPPTPAPSPAPPPAPAESAVHLIKSPTPGTFYRSSSPDAA